jgi:hypothetical protein
VHIFVCGAAQSPCQARWSAAQLGCWLCSPWERRVSKEHSACLCDTDSVLFYSSPTNVSDASSWSVSWIIFTVRNYFISSYNLRPQIFQCPTQKNSDIFVPLYKLITSSWMQNKPVNMMFIRKCNLSNAWSAVLEIGDTFASKMFWTPYFGHNTNVVNTLPSKNNVSN